MSRSLVIVESPTKARTINKYLGSDYDVRSCMGHVRDLPEHELGVDVEHEFRPKYTVLEGKEKIVRELRSLGKQAATVYLATDPDREGEAIAWHVAQVMGLPVQAARRITFHEITRSAIQQAISQPHDIDMRKVDAQQARRVLDRLVGYQVSPLLWKTVRRGLSAGRVQSVALRMVCDREEVIERFVPEEYWTIGVLLDNGRISFEADLWKVDGEHAKVPDEEHAQALAKEIEGTTFAIEKIETRRQKRRPAPPFITSTLEQEASRKYQMPSFVTMRVAQQLYEGIEAGGETTGLITYMRTDSTRVADEAMQAAREYVAARYGAEYRPARANVYKSRETAQEAHEAIRPTSVERSPDDIKDFLTRDQLRLYRLIWNRFVASQMVPQELDVTTVTAAGGRLALRARMTIEAFDGFTRVYSEGRDEGPGEEVEHPIPRALLEAWKRAPGQPEKEPDLAGYAATNVTPEQQFTKPPSRYTEATLIKELEANGIGRPSTYAQIVVTILERTYVAKAEGQLKPTDLGRVVSRILVSQFPDLFNVEFTAQMEGELDRIEQGDDHWKKMLADFYGDFQRTLARAMEQRAEIKKSTIEETSETCEKCGRPMVVRFGPRGKFLSCSGFPECKNARPLAAKDAEPTPVPDVKCPVCGGPMVLRNGRFGEFLACERYPECRGTSPIPTGVNCPRPDCGGRLVMRSSKRGRRFYGCENYPNCDVVYWDRPVPIEEPDPASGLRFKLEKVARDGSTRLVSAAYPPAQGRRRAASAEQGGASSRSASEKATGEDASSETKRTRAPRRGTRRRSP